MRLDLEEVTPPTTEPISVEELADHLRIETVDEYPRLAALITAARRWVESMTGRQLLPATWRLRLDALCAPIVLPRPPLRQVISVTYVDVAGVTQTLSPTQYQVLQPTGPWAGPARIVPSYGAIWPATRPQAQAAAVTYECGYDREECPLIEAVRWYAEYLYEPLADGLRMAAIQALTPYRVSVGPAPWVE